jgi:integrase
MPLTDTAVKALKTKHVPYKVFDGGGLYLEVLPTGTKVWRIKYSFEKKDRRFTLGHYPVITLREARMLLFAAKESLASGIDPARQKAESANARTFEAVALDWIEKQTPRWSAIHKQIVSTRLKAHALPHIGKSPIAEITPPDVLRFIRLIENRGKNETAFRVLGICSQVFRYGVSCGICQSDPCRDLRGALTAHTGTPRPALTNPDDVGKLMAAIHSYRGSSIMRSAILWSAYTFCRPGEVRRAEWTEIIWEKKEWRIPAEKMKMRFEHRVPLARQCMEILEKVREKKLSDVWIFPGTRRFRPLSENGVLSALRRMGYKKNEMTAHGFRAMASTLLNELGYRPDIIEKQLAHGDSNKIRAIYNRAAYMDDRRVMMQDWADYLDGLTAQKQFPPGQPGIHE